MQHADRSFMVSKTLFSPLTQVYNSFEKKTLKQSKTDGLL